jgi:hypothetical protein
MLLKNEIAHWPTRLAVLLFSYAAHLFNFYLLVYVPFGTFLAALNL